ncbi:MAG TPA: MAPEG family protein [Gammaproteobacteria bacterium]|nr:MAPEG family protein [Gammaproteobacteria bacterium]
MEPVYIVILVALLEYIVFTGLVGRARGRYGIKAPATVGHPDFERVYRVQQNTLESLIVFVPAIWIFGLYVSAAIGAAFGTAFVVARSVYAVGYIRAAEQRSIGAMLTAVINGILVLWALIALLLRALG